MTTGEVIALIKAFGGSGGGSSGGVLVVEMVYDEESGNFIGNKTGSECYSAFTTGGPVILHVNDAYFVVIGASISGGQYSFVFYVLNDDSHHEATAETASTNIHAYLE